MMGSPAIGRASYLQDISAPAVMLPTSPYGEPFAIFGAGEDARACFLGDNHTFHVMPAIANENWQGAVIENLAIELDWSAVVDPTHDTPPIGSMVRIEDRLEMIVVDKVRGFSNRSRLVVERGLPASPPRLELAFPKWQLILRDGDREIFRREVIARNLPDVR